MKFLSKINLKSPILLIFFISILLACFSFAGAKASALVDSVTNSTQNSNETQVIEDNSVANDWLYVRFYLGDEQIMEQKVTEGGVASKPAEPIVGDYMVEGWYQNPDFSGDPWIFDAMVVTSNLNLYAKVKLATVEFGCSEGGHIDTEGSSTYPAISTQYYAKKVLTNNENGQFVLKNSKGDIEYKNVNAIADNGYVFAGWNIEGTSEYGQLNEGLNSYIAKFAPIVKIFGKVTDKNTLEPLKGASASFYDRTHMVRYYTNTDENGDYSLNIPMSCDGEFMITSENHRLFKEDLNSTDTSDDLERNVGLTATRTVHFLNRDNTEISWENVDYGTSVERPEDPYHPGSTFINWYKDRACTNLYDFENEKITEDTNIYARFIFDKVNLTGRICDHVTGTPLVGVNVSFISDKLYGPIESGYGGLFYLNDVKGALGGQLILEKDGYQIKFINVDYMSMEEDYNFGDIALSNVFDAKLKGDEGIVNFAMDVKVGEKTTHMDVLELPNKDLNPWFVPFSSLIKISDNKLIITSTDANKESVTEITPECDKQYSFSAWKLNGNNLEEGKEYLASTYDYIDFSAGTQLVSPEYNEGSNIANTSDYNVLAVIALLCALMGSWFLIRFANSQQTKEHYE